MTQLPSKNSCIICGKSFEPAMYMIHLQEEMLKQLLILNDRTNDIADAMLLTYAYMRDEENTLQKDYGVEEVPPDVDSNEKEKENEKPEPEKIGEATIPTIDTKDVESFDTETDQIGKKPIVTDAEFQALVDKALKNG